MKKKKYRKVIKKDNLLNVRTCVYYALYTNKLEYFILLLSIKNI